MNIIKRIGIRKFIREIDKDIKVKFQKYDMECDIYEETVYIGKTYDSRNDKFFMEFVKELNPECNIPVLPLSILHEIGHIMTWDEDAADEKDMIYALLKVNFDESEKDDATLKEYDDMYFRIPLEQNATQWGIDFAMSHPELIEKYNWIWK